MEFYQPSAVVLQCGSDSLAGDKLGCFNLSMRGHANCVEFVKSFGLPLLLLGGGGYTMRNVSRAWAYETGLAAGQELSSQVPVNEYYEYFGPDYKLDVRPNNMEDLNTREYLEKIKIQVFENLRNTAFAPSVQGHVAPTLPRDDEMDEEDERLKEGDDAQDIRASKDQRQRDRRVQRNGELSDSEDEGEGGRKDRRDHGDCASGSPAAVRPSIMEPLRRRQQRETNGVEGAASGGSVGATMSSAGHALSFSAGPEVELPAPGVHKAVKNANSGSANGQKLDDATKQANESATDPPLAERSLEPSNRASLGQPLPSEPQNAIAGALVATMAPATENENGAAPMSTTSIAPALADVEMSGP